MITLTKEMKFFALGIIILLTFTVSNVYALQQTAGLVQLDIKPGQSDTFIWGLKSDMTDADLTVYLSAEGEGSQFLSFPKSVILPPQELIYHTITVTIPDDYPGGIDLKPEMIATEFGKSGGAARINIQMVKTVNLNIAPNVDPDLRVDWDAIKAAQELQASSESQAAPVGQESSEEAAGTSQESQAPQIEQQTTPGTQEPGGPLSIGSSKPQMDPEPGMELEREMDIESTPQGGGCLIATATYGSELAPQVQMLREIRDNIVLQTQSGDAFMTAFNQIYYSFSPTIADWERQNPAFKELVKLTITPMVTSLSILDYVDIETETQMLGWGLSIIALNLTIYLAAPTIGSYKMSKYLRSRK